ncbi:MAG: ATP-binding protein [Ruminococcus sp.]|nr:ATP-binding protein [Ruminococcus sp.]
MEQVSNILAALSTKQTVAEEAMERPQDLNQTEGNTNKESSGEKFKIRSDVAIAEGWDTDREPPQPEKCQYCGRTLYYYGVKDFLGKKRVFTWFEEPERCTCIKAQAHRQEQERLEAEAKEAENQRKKAEVFNAKVRRLIQNSGMRGRFTNRTFDKFEVNDMNRRAYEKCKRYADSFGIMLPTEDERGNKLPPKKERNGLFITGSYGTGKTHLASAIANQLIHGGMAVICMTMIDLLAKIKNSFDTDTQVTEAAIMKLYEEIPLLIIDDIGSEQPTEWGSTRIYAIINARYEAYMPTIVTTNYTGDELIRRMTPTYGGKPGDTRNAEKTLDRLREMCVGIEMYWESWRTR